mmetsp:Transcript_3293/g.8458  ORF Transcript_3293/g.8458 Transcript_3293/m.8458 type:complete len:224 (-) Transcript_3293:1256-1927(-)
MWKLLSSSFSNDRGLIFSPPNDPTLGSFPSAALAWSTTLPSSTSIRSSSPSGFFSPVSILASLDGTNSPTFTLLSIALNTLASRTGLYPLTLYTCARRFAAAMIKPMCTGSSASNTIAEGNRFGGDQNGAPLAFFMSCGHENTSCLILLLKYSSNLLRAQATHSSIVRTSPLPSTRHSITPTSTSFVSLAAPVPSGNTAPPSPQILLDISDTNASPFSRYCDA